LTEQGTRLATGEWKGASNLIDIEAAFGIVRPIKAEQPLKAY